MNSFKKKRCEWAGSNPLMVKYHDEEWGTPVHDDTTLFEFLILEGAQAGLSWTTILNRREGYRKAFDNFDIQKVAGYNEEDLESLLQNPEIIRNKLKIKSAINNAQRVMTIQNEYGSLNRYIWSFVNDTTIQNRFEELSQIPSSTEISHNMSKDMKKHKLSFVGPTICYAFMQAVGLVNDHTIDCFRYEQIYQLSMTQSSKKSK